MNFCIRQRKKGILPTVLSDLSPRRRILQELIPRWTIMYRSLQRFMVKIKQAMSLY